MSLTNEFKLRYYLKNSVLNKIFSATIHFTVHWGDFVLKLIYPLICMYKYSYFCIK